MKRKSQKPGAATIKSFAEGLMQMSIKGALAEMRLTRPRAEALLKAFNDVIYYFPPCVCGSENDCHCDDKYFAGIHWAKQRIFRIYPDLSEIENPLPGLFAETELEKLTAVYLKSVLNIADDLFGDDLQTKAGIEWAANLVHKKYSVFDLCE